VESKNKNLLRKNPEKKSQTPKEPDRNKGNTTQRGVRKPIVSLILQEKKKEP